MPLLKKNHKNRVIIYTSNVNKASAETIKPQNKTCTTNHVRGGSLDFVSDSANVTLYGIVRE